MLISVVRKTLGSSANIASYDAVNISLYGAVNVREWVNVMREFLNPLVR